MNQLHNIKEAALFIKKELNRDAFDTAVVMGSGLSFNDEFFNGDLISYNAIPHYPLPSVEGHSGSLLYSRYHDKHILFFLGRIHYYEGFSMHEVVFPIRLMKELGIRNLIVTNASGSVSKRFKTGDIMLIKDHINLMGTNPLIGANITEHGPRFVDMTDCYSKKLMRVLTKKLKISLKKGIYAAVSGPSYETKAEVRSLNKMGVHAVGMSTVPEVITASHCGIQTLGLSCITNENLKRNQKVSHEEVIENAQVIKERLLMILKVLLKAL